MGSDGSWLVQLELNACGLLNMICRSCRCHEVNDSELVTMHSVISCPIQLAHWRPMVDSLDTRALSSVMIELQS